MDAVNWKLARGIFGSLVVGALGFGATQALATPVQAARAACTLQQTLACQNYCASLGMTRSLCSDFGYPQCQCSYGPYMPNDP